MPPFQFFLLAALALVGHTVFWVGFVNRTHAYGWPHKLVDALTALSAAALAGVPLWALWRWWAGGQVGVTADLPLAIYGGAMAPLTVIAAVHQAWLRVHPERRAVARRVSARRVDFRPQLGLQIARPVPRMFCRIPGNQVLTLSVEQLTLGVPRLPAELVGLKIALMADLHMSGRFGLELYQRIIEQANACAPDMVLLAGDLVEKDHCIPWVKETYGRLTAPLGVYYVLGNHDKKVDHPGIRAALDAEGAVEAPAWYRGPGVAMDDTGPGRFVGPVGDGFDVERTMGRVTWMDGQYRAPGNDDYETAMDRLSTELQKAGFGGAADEAGPSAPWGRRVGVPGDEDGWVWRPKR